MIRDPEDIPRPYRRSATIGMVILILCLLLTSAQRLGAVETVPSVIVAHAGEVTITWEARTATDGAVFRLYRSIQGGVPAFVAEVPAELGPRTYRVSDNLPPNETVVYRLFVIADRHEFELGALIRIDVQTCEATIASTESPTPRALAFGAPVTASRGSSLANPPQPPGDRDGFKPPPDPPVPRSVTASAAT